MEIQPLPELNDLQSRLRFDYQVVMQMRSPLMVVEAYRNVDDLTLRQTPILRVEEGHLATYYRVDYHIKTLIGPGRYSNKTTVKFDLFADNNYPVSQPSCFVIEGTMPWSPHFYEDQPVCVGDIWEEAEGGMLLGELMVHVAKLLNFDEPEYDDPRYGGYSPEAIDYWVRELNRQPLTRNLPYPVLPDLVSPAPVAEPPRSNFTRKNVTGGPPPIFKSKSTGLAKPGPTRIRIKARETHTE
jgi:hypothetical protein